MRSSAPITSILYVDCGTQFLRGTLFSSYIGAGTPFLLDDLRAFAGTKINKHSSPPTPWARKKAARLRPKFVSEQGGILLFLPFFFSFFFLSRACLLRKRAPVEEVDRWCESVCLLLLAKAKLPIILLPPSASGPLVSVAVRPLESQPRLLQIVLKSSLSALGVTPLFLKVFFFFY